MKKKTFDVDDGVDSALAVDGSARVDAQVLLLKKHKKF